MSELDFAVTDFCESLIRLIHASPFRSNQLSEIHTELEFRFHSASIFYSCLDSVTYLVSGIALVCAVAEDFSLEPYLTECSTDDSIHAVILLTNRFFKAPETLNGKPIYQANLRLL